MRSPSSRTWTPEQFKLLDVMAGRTTVDEIVRRLAAIGPPHTKTAVYNTASARMVSLRLWRRHKRPEPAFHRWPWTREQEDTLRTLAGTMRAHEITTEMNHRFHTERGLGSIWRRARKLGISLRPRGRLGMLDLVSIFPLGLKTIPKLVERGYLQARVVGSGTKGAEWWFDERDVEQFLRDYPYLVDWRRVQAGRWRDLARAASLRSPWFTASQVADRFGLRRLLVASWCRQGLVPGVVRRLDGSTTPYCIPRSALTVIERLTIERGVRTAPAYRRTG